VSEITIREFESIDIPWAEDMIGAQLGGRLQARRGELVDALACPGFVAEVGGAPAGIVTYDDRGQDVEIVYLEVERQRRLSGIGTALIQAVIDRVPAEKIWLVTTNDNIDALRFYQRRGFRICEVRAGAVTEARRQLKPGIPEVGDHSIPIRDEFELVFAP
jgi:ribosomal protein S18 acetylase RimI-like enzyme